ncbi:hypothetical protein TNCV_1892471 [Trichonephila clavipes]|nr:hypothetical protein TNCV_1892471 [Trichonephila clavipes]
MHLKQPWLDVLKERKHEHSRRKASISRVYKIGRRKFPTLPQGIQIPEVPISSSNHSNRLDFGASWTRRAIVCPFYCGRDGFRSSGLSPYIHNGGLSSKAVKRRQWAERVRPAEHVSDTCWFVKKPEEGEREKREERSSKRQGLVVLGSGEENPRVFLFRDADQESKTRMRNNALRTGPRQAVDAREVPAFRFFPEKDEEDVSSVSTCIVKGGEGDSFIIPAFEEEGEKSLAKVNGVEFKEEQRKCPDLKPLWDKALTGIDKEFRVIGGKLVRVAKTKRGEEVRQLCIPIKFRLDINKLSHDEIGEHLVVTKTKDRILRHFFGRTCTETWRSSSKLAIRVNE